MNSIDKLHRILKRFPEDYVQGIIRNFRESVDPSISEERLQELIDVKLQEDNLISFRGSETFYLKEYLYIRAYEEVEGAVGRYDPDLPDYQCKLVKKSEKYYILEIIGKSLLEDRDFYSFDEWKTYLQRLSTTGIIELVDCLQLNPTHRTVTIYGIPENYHILDQRIHRHLDALANPRIVLDFLKKLNWACSQTVRITNRTDRKRTFSFVTTHSHLLLVNDQLDPMLCAIGASLPSRTVYVSSNRHGKTKHPYGMGFSAYSFFAGLLLFELLTDQCPIEQMEQHNSPETKLYLSESESLDQYPRHINAFIKRATHAKSDWRYTSFERVAEDLEHIVAYLEYSNQHSLCEVQAEVVQFVDFLRLRFKSHSVNPRLGNLPLEDSSRWLVSSLADDFSLYFKEADKFHNLYKAIIEKNDQYQSILHNRNSTPLTQYLIQYFSFWSSLNRYWQARPNPTLAFEVETLGISFLLVTLEYEFMAFTQSLARKNQLNKKLSTTNRVIPKTEVGFQYLFTLEPKKYRTASFSNEAINLVNSLIVSDTKIHISDSLGRFDAISLFILWAYSSLEIVDADNNIKFSNLDSSMRNSKSHDILSIAWLIWEYHCRITQIFPKRSDFSSPSIFPESDTLDEWWEFSKELLEIIWKNLPMRRTSAKIIRYKKKIHLNDEGRISYRNKVFWPIMGRFDESDLIHRSDIDRSVTSLSAKIDFFPKHKDELGGVFVKPILGFPSILKNQSQSSIMNAKLDTKQLIAILSKGAKVLSGILILLGLWFALLQIQPIAQIAADPLRGPAPLEIRFSNASSNADNFRWVFGNLEESGEFNPSFTFEEPGEYIVTLYAYRSPNWEFLGFINSDTVIIHVLPPDLQINNNDVESEATNEAEATQDTSPTHSSP